MAFAALHLNNSSVSHSLAAALHAVLDMGHGLAEGFSAASQAAEETDRLNAVSDRKLSEMGISRGEIPVLAARRAMGLKPQA